MERTEERVVTELEVLIPVPAMSAAYGRETPGVVEECLCSSIGICRRAKC